MNFVLLMHVLLALGCIFNWFDEIVSILGFLIVTFSDSNPIWYERYMKEKWKELPIIAASPIPEIQAVDFTREEFSQLTKGFTSPAIIRGALNNNTTGLEWTRQYVEKHYGNTTSIVRQLIDDCRDAQNPYYRRETISKYYKYLDEGKNVFIQASSAVFEHHPKILVAASTEFGNNLTRNGKSAAANMLFYNHGNSSAYFHADIAANLNRQLSGSKEWTLLSPDQNFYMCPKAVAKGSSLKPQCLLSLSESELTSYIQRLPRYTVTSNAGDLLYVPPWWWHEVVSLRAEINRDGLDNGAILGEHKATVSVAGFVADRWLSFYNFPVAFASAVVMKLWAFQESKNVAEMSPSQVEDAVWNRLVQFQVEDECVLKHNGKLF